MVNGFSLVLFSSEPLISMVFHMSTIGINGFPMSFNVEPLVSMIFPMVTVYLVFWLWMTEME